MDNIACCIWPRTGCSSVATGEFYLEVSLHAGQDYGAKRTILIYSFGFKAACLPVTMSRRRVVVTILTGSFQLFFSLTFSLK